MNWCACAFSDLDALTANFVYVTVFYSVCSLQNDTQEKHVSLDVMSYMCIQSIAQDNSMFFVQRTQKFSFYTTMNLQQQYSNFICCSATQYTLTTMNNKFFDCQNYRWSFCICYFETLNQVLIVRQRVVSVLYLVLILHAYPQLVSKRYTY